MQCLMFMCICLLFVYMRVRGEQLKFTQWFHDLELKTGPCRFAFFADHNISGWTPSPPQEECLSWIWGKNKNQNKLPSQSACLPSIVSVSFLKLSSFQICPALVALVPRLPDWSTLGHEASVGFLRDLPMPGACWHADHVTEFHPRAWIKELPRLVEI